MLPLRFGLTQVVVDVENMLVTLNGIGENYDDEHFRTFNDCANVVKEAFDQLISMNEQKEYNEREKGVYKDLICNKIYGATRIFLKFCEGRKEYLTPIYNEAYAQFQKTTAELNNSVQSAMSGMEETSSITSLSDLTAISQSTGDSVTSMDNAPTIAQNVPTSNDFAPVEENINTQSNDQTNEQTNSGQSLGIARVRTNQPKNPFAVYPAA